MYKSRFVTTIIKCICDKINIIYINKLSYIAKQFIGRFVIRIAKIIVDG